MGNVALQPKAPWLLRRGGTLTGGLQCDVHVDAYERLPIPKCSKTASLHNARRDLWLLTCYFQHNHFQNEHLIISIPYAILLSLMYSFSLCSLGLCNLWPSVPSGDQTAVLYFLQCIKL